MLAELAAIFAFLTPIVTVLSSPSPSLPYYVCSSYGNMRTVDYYGYGRDHSFHFPTQWSLVDQRGYCTDECWPCEPYHLRHQTMMIGYGGTCTISYEEQVRLGLYNVTTEEFHDAPKQLTKMRPIRLHDTVNPFELSGVFESKPPHLFISKYSLCIYPIRHYISIKPVYIPQQRKRIISYDEDYQDQDQDQNDNNDYIENKEKKIVDDEIIIEPAKEPVKPYETTTAPTRPVEPTKEPVRPYETTTAPTRSVEPTKEPVRPYETTTAPTRPVEPTKEPQRPYETTMVPTRPVEPTKEPQRPYETTTAPTRPIEPTKEPVRSFETTTALTRPIEPTKEPVRSFETTTAPTRPVEPTKEPVRPYETTTAPTRSVEPTKEPVRPYETTTAPTRPVEPTKEPFQLLETTTAPTRPVEAPLRPFETTTAPTRPVEAPVRPFETTTAPTRPVEPTKKQFDIITPTPSTRLPDIISILPTRYASMGEQSVQTVSTSPLPPSTSSTSPLPPSASSTSSTPPSTSPSFSSETLTIILMSLLGILSIMVILLIVLIFCKKEKSTTNLPSDMQRYIEKHNDMLVLRFDQDRPEKVAYPKEINTPKYIEYNDVANHIAVSWSTLHHLYTAVKANWKLINNDTGMKKYIPNLSQGDKREGNSHHLLIIYKAFRISDEIMTPDKTYVLTKVVLSNDQPDLMAFVIEEKMVYFRQKFILLAHKDHLTHITVKTNLPDYHVFQNFSYKTFEAFTEHSIHDKILIASRHKKEYDEINLSDVENGTCDLRRVATLTDQNKKALEYVKEIETIKRGLENTTFKLNY